MKVKKNDYVKALEDILLSYEWCLRHGCKENTPLGPSSDFAFKILNKATNGKYYRGENNILMKKRKILDI